jgi:hypothetical protein
VTNSGAARKMRDCRPLGAALRGEASNRPLLRWLKTVVVSGEGKGARDASGGGQEGVASKVPKGIHRLIASLLDKVASEPGHVQLARDEPGGCPDCWPGGARRIGGASLACGFRAERGMACPDTAIRKDGEREGSKRLKRKEQSTVAGRAGGPVRSSGEAPA